MVIFRLKFQTRMCRKQRASFSMFYTDRGSWEVRFCLKNRFTFSGVARGIATLIAILDWSSSTLVQAEISQDHSWSPEDEPYWLKGSCDFSSSATCWSKFSLIQWNVFSFPIIMRMRFLVKFLDNEWIDGFRHSCSPQDELTKTKIHRFSRQKTAF